MAGTLLPAACWAACWIAAAMAALAAAVAAHEWAHMLVAWCFGLEASMQAGGCRRPGLPQRSCPFLDAALCFSAGRLPTD